MWIFGSRYELRFFGFDAPIEMMGADSPGEALSFLATYLTLHLGGNELPGTLERIGSLVGDNDRWTNPAAALDPSQSAGGSQDVKELRLIAEDLLTLLASEAPRLLVDSSRDELWEAELHGRSAAGLLAYHSAMADDSTQRVSRLLAIRDKLMADNLYSLTELEMRQGPTLVFAHNQHLLKGESRWQFGEEDLRWWCAGALLSARLGDEYAVMGSAIGATPRHGISRPEGETLEGLLYVMAEDRCLVPTAPLVAAIEETGTVLVQRASTNPSYFPLNPNGLEEFDAILCLKDIDV